jgi:hypothetical protein
MSAKLLESLRILEGALVASVPTSDTRNTSSAPDADGELPVTIVMARTGCLDLTRVRTLGALPPQRARAPTTIFVPVLVS